MRLNLVNLKGTVAATIVTLLLVSSAHGQSVAGSAPATGESGLLRALAEAAPEDAPGLDRELQALWSRSGSASMDLLLKRGRDALEAGDTVAAIDHLSALTDHAPDFAEGWHLRASAFFEAGRLGLAVQDLGRALALNPNNYNAIFGLGAILESVGDEKGAFAAYERAQAIHPHHEDVSNALERLKPAVSGKAL